MEEKKINKKQKKTKKPKNIEIKIQWKNKEILNRNNEFSKIKTETRKITLERIKKKFFLKKQKQSKNQTWPIKWNADSSKQRSCRYCYMDALHRHYKTDGEKAWRQLHKNAASFIEQVLQATPHKAAPVRPPTTDRENYPSQTNQTCRTLLEKLGWAHRWCTPMDPSYSRAKAGQ